MIWDDKPARFDMYPHAGEAIDCNIRMGTFGVLFMCAVSMPPIDSGIFEVRKNRPLIRIALEINAPELVQLIRGYHQLSVCM